MPFPIFSVRTSLMWDQENLIVELTGNQSKLDACINLLSNYEILELARTGIAGLGRGTEDVVYIDL